MGYLVEDFGDCRGQDTPFARRRGGQQDVVYSYTGVVLIRIIEGHT